MGAGDLDSVMQPGEFLVAYDYGMGGLWGVLVAPSREAILKKYPELGIADALPAWMNLERLERLRQDRLWLGEEPPQGLLKALVADRGKT
ncbi:hypothetical protein [Cellulomonas sp. KRMCY2]|uniref:hypothetical protein n=1 Tax=Cellulomonas sp. KRMCY2 TaxID=1304865 RepID=UPI00045EC021|nr:hypothetical protein [Cellulomonas sp. KRMCY2]